MLLRGKGLANSFNTFLFIAAANNIPKLSFPFSQYKPITDNNFILFIYNLAGWVLPGLEILNK